ncbi:MAG: hypothetical protein R3C10_18850 [Pirellulales bacterium]
MSSVLTIDLSTITDNAPKCIRQLTQWVAWRYVERDGKPTKAPVNPRTGSLAKSTEPDTWGTFEEAIAACQSDQQLAGVGFVFTADDNYCGVDLDNSIDPESGQLKRWAADIVDRLDSYTEISPSGTGLKVFLKANKPGSRCRKAYHDGEVEIYDNGRFFTLTGQRLDTASATIEDRQTQLRQVYGAVFGEDDDHTAACPANKPRPNPSDIGHVSLNDDQIIDLASSQRRSGAKFLRSGRATGTLTSTQPARRIRRWCSPWRSIPRTLRRSIGCFDSRD